MPVTLQFVEDDHFYDPVVEFVSHGWPTHVDIVIDVHAFERVTPPQLQLPNATPILTDGYMLLGARPRGGVMLRPKDYSNFRRVARVTLPATADQEDEFYAFLKPQLGKPYDFANVCGFAINVHENPDGKWFCSMLALAALCSAKVLPQHPASAAYEVDPWDLFLICSALAPVQWIGR